MIQNFADSITNSWKEKQQKLDDYTNGLNNEIANITSFKPLKLWWTSFVTHKLKNLGNWIYSFVPTPLSKIFSWIFALIWIVEILFFVILSVSNNAFQIEFLGMIIMWTIFPIAWFFLFRSFKAKTFDTNLWYFYVGSPKSDPQLWLHNTVNTSPNNPKNIDLTFIHALQIISEYIVWKSNFYSYELNLVHQDGSRINLVDHKNLNQIQEDAKILSSVLSIPLRDITNL